MPRLSQRLFVPAVICLIVLFPAVIKPQTTDPPIPKVSKTNSRAPVRLVPKEEALVSDRGKIAEAIGTSGHTLADTAIALNNEGVKFAENKRFREARSVLEQAVKLDDAIPGIHVNLSTVYESLNMPKEAVEAARRAVELDPLSPRARTQLCELEIVNKNFSAAALCYGEFQKGHKLDSLSMSNFGLALMRTGKLDEAENAFKKSIRMTPMSASPYIGLGYLKYNQKKFKEAAKAFKRAVELGPERDDSRFNLAMAQLANGNKAGALSQYKFLKKLNPELAQKIYRVIFRDKVIFVPKK